MRFRHGTAIVSRNGRARVTRKRASFREGSVRFELSPRRTLVMMKRPRSFIATLLILICIAVSVGTLTAPGWIAQAGTLTSRLMNPIAGDPQEPTDSYGQSGNLGD